MRTGWQIGSVLGIPLLIDSSWFFILALVTFFYGSSLQGGELSPTATWIVGLVMALLLFGSVLLHELGHSLVARSQGIIVNSITLFLFGGVASIDQESKTPGQAFQVAIAGPSVSFAIFLLLTLISQFAPLSEPFAAVLSDLAGINLVLALFNMIPGLPLDGGQVLKAAVWKLTGSRHKGVRWSARTGQALGWAAVIFGITAYLSYRRLDLLWLALLGWFGVRNARAYGRVVDLQEALVSLTAVTAMTREFRVADADMTIRQFADKYLHEESDLIVYYAASDGRYRGMVSIGDLRSVERGQWETQPLHSVVHPLTEIPTVQEITPLTQVIDTLETQSLRQITVLSPADSVAGVIDRGDVVRAVADRLNVPISEAIIRRIKEEGAYPPGLQLQAIAKAAVE
ncbi:site-2 protease family protein [Oculatella sp. FACHB-28]|uniref:site-2 protease family protein n=1 Tax=Cyanophyceae TaxID=3028117 RepID=UPI0016882FF2|nr:MULTISPECIES: site-2 protease family protein [Cyanophyceae]MBD1998204.1 site-2 protease family protein [Leptolyngbya sp. FACHB-541]MBD2057134.1 site-2 protease family protein [Oculatella sp. FACHB-28]